MSDRESRGSEEGEGRSDFDREVYPRSYPVPGRLNLKRAMRAYVHGHDRGWDAERKAEIGESGPPDGDGDTEAGYQGAGQALDSGERTARPGAESGPDPGPADAREGTRYGVPVPDELDFHRSADTWRDRIPHPHTARRPAGWPGSGPSDDEPRREE